MQDSALTQIVLPLILGFIMLGMGLSLRPADFGRLLGKPLPVVAGLLGQMALMPLLAAAIAIGFNLTPELAIGMMILAACPGGTTSNIISHILRANLALAVSLTALSTVLCVITTPLLIKASILYFSDGAAADFSIFRTSLSMIAITIVPISIGMVVRHFAEGVADKAEPWVRRFAIVFMLAIIVAVVVKERAVLEQYFADLVGATMALNIGSMILGVVLGRLFALSWGDQLTLGVEVGIQNTTLSFIIAISIIGEPQFAISAGIYSLAMYVGAVLFGFVVWKRRPKAEAVEA